MLGFLLILLFLNMNVTSQENGSFKKINDGLYITKFGHFYLSEPIYASGLVFEPLKSVVFGNSLELNGLAIKSNKSIFSIEMRNLKGFDLATNPLEKIKFYDISFRKTIFYIVDSKLDYYHRNELLGENCSAALFNEPNLKHQLLKFYGVSFTKGIKYSDKTCPIIFQNSVIKFIEIKYLSLTFLLKNKLEFVNASFDGLDTDILQLILDGYHYELSEKLVNKYVFNKIGVLDVSGPINLIQPDLFKNFNDLRMVRLKTQYLKNLFVRSNKWIESLNTNVYIDFSQGPKAKDSLDKILILVLYQMYIGISYYDYPDEDFCYFVNFPHEKLVMPLLAPEKASSCSCTELFLISHSKIVRKYIDYYVNYHISNYYSLQYYTDEITRKQFFTKCVNESFDFYYKECKFVQRKNNCLIRPIRPLEKEFYFYSTDLQVMSLSGFNFLFISNKILYFICIFTYLLSIRILNSKKKNSKEFYKTYKYLTLHNVFNILHVLLSFLELACNENLINCDFENKIYLRYFKLIVVKFLSNVTKTVSNVSYLSFTFSRFNSLANFNCVFVKKLDNISIKKYTVILLSFGSAINFYTLFQYNLSKQNFAEKLNKETIAANFSNYYRPFNQYDYREDFHFFDHVILNVFQIIRIIFSDTIYILFSIFIDFLFFLFVKKQMKKKKSLLFLNLADNENKVKCQTRKMRLANRSSKRIATIIILNGLNFFLFRLPSALFSFYAFIYIYDKTEMKYKPSVIGYIICRSFKLCKTLAELFQTFYLVSYILQFFILVILDKNFREGLNEFLKYNHKLNYIYKAIHKIYDIQYKFDT